MSSLVLSSWRSRRQTPSVSWRERRHWRRTSTSTPRGPWTSWLQTAAPPTERRNPPPQGYASAQTSCTVRSADLSVSLVCDSCVNQFRDVNYYYNHIYILFYFFLSQISVDIEYIDNSLRVNGHLEYMIELQFQLKVNWPQLQCNLYFGVSQVHYDLGGIFFQQGCTDQLAYEKAREHFRQTKEILQKVTVNWCWSVWSCLNSGVLEVMGNLEKSQGF